MTEVNNEVAEAEIETSAEVPAETPVAEVPVEAAPAYEFDARFYNDDKSFNPEGMNEVMTEMTAVKDSAEKSAMDMRKMVSAKGEIVSTKEGYFNTYKADDRFNKFFHEDTPVETKEAMDDIKSKLADKYLSLGFNKKQGSEVSDSILEIMEEFGVLDTRTEDQKLTEKQTNVDAQKLALGANAEVLIREANVFLSNTPQLSAEVKELLAGMMETNAAGTTNLLHQLKGQFGGAGTGIPSGIDSLGGLASDAELWAEYGKANPTRRTQINAQRGAAGRTGMLSDAGPV